MQRLFLLGLLLCTACPAPSPHPCEAVGIAVDDVTGELDAPCHGNDDCNEGLGCSSNCTDEISDCMGVCARLDDPHRFCRFGPCEDDIDCGEEEAAEGTKVCRGGYCVRGPNAEF